MITPHTTESHTVLFCTTSTPSVLRWTVMSNSSRASKPQHTDLRGPGEPGLHRVRIDQAGLLELEIATVEHGEVRNSLNVVARGQLREAFGVDFEHHGAAGKFTRHLGDVRGRHAAGATPCGPEIDEHRNFAVAHNFIELFRTNFNGIGKGRQCGLAGAALSSVGEMLGRNSIRLSARWAISNDRHAEVLWLKCRLNSIAPPMGSGNCILLARILRDCCVAQPMRHGRHSLPTDIGLSSSQLGALVHQAELPLKENLNESTLSYWSITVCRILYQQRNQPPERSQVDGRVRTRKRRATTGVGGDVVGGTAAAWRGQHLAGREAQAWCDGAARFSGGSLPRHARLLAR